MSEQTASSYPLEDGDGNIIYPPTLTSVVFDENSKRLDTVLANIPRLGKIDPEPVDTIPRDADTLGGHAPDYFATNDSLNGKLDVAKIDKGTISLPSVSKGNYGTIDVNFNHSFSSSPKVMLTLYSSQGNIHRVYLQVSVSTITQNGFTVAYAYDGSATLGTTSVNWVAIG